MSWGSSQPLAHGNNPHHDIYCYRWRTYYKTGTFLRSVYGVTHMSLSTTREVYVLIFPCNEIRRQRCRIIKLLAKMHAETKPWSQNISPIFNVSAQLPKRTERRPKRLVFSQLEFLLQCQSLSLKISRQRKAAHQVHTLFDCESFTLEHYIPFQE